MKSPTAGDRAHHRPWHVDVRAIGDLVDAALTTIEHRFAGAHPPGVRTGFYDLDELLGGLQPGSLTVLAGPPAVGKSAVALAVATHVSRASAAVLFATNELSAQVIAARLLASEAAVDGMRVRDGRLRERDWRAIGRAVGVVEEMALYVADSVVSLDALRASALELASQRLLRLIVLDRLDPLLADNRREAQLAAIAALAHDLSVPLLATASARPMDRDGAEGPTGHVAAEDVVIDAADAMILLDRSSSIGRDVTAMNVHLIKNRSGPTGTVRLAMHTSVPLVRNAARPPHETAPGDDATSASDYDLNGPSPIPTSRTMIDATPSGVHRDR